jgi:RNA polymerase sigma-70 factor (ECF subfamily)
LLPVSDDIIKGCLQQDAASQEQLYRICYPVMIKLCTRYSNDKNDAGAIYNEAMLKVFKHFRQFRGQGDLAAWIRKIIVNTCVDFCRRQIKFVHQPPDETIVNDTITLDPEVYGRISCNEVMRLLAELPRTTALVFNLFAIEGYKHEEIGKLLDISAGTSKWHVNEARRILKSKLDGIVNKKFYLNAI